MVKYLHKLIPQDIYNKRINLEPLLGVKESAWDFETVLKIIKILANQNYIILGGDVYFIKDKIIQPTYDSWYITEKETLNSVNTAIDYIINYNKNNGANYIYSLVIDCSPNNTSFI